MKPCLLPSVLDFGAVQPGNKAGGAAGICNWPRADQVTATIVNDNSGGLFTGFELGVYDVELVPGGGSGPPMLPRPHWELVQVATGDGSIPLPVAAGQTIGVGLFFNAPGQSSGRPYTAEILILSAGAVAATIPVNGIVEAPDFTGEWTLANPFGIEIQSLSTVDPLIGVWHAGRVNDAIVVQSSGALLLATDAAGVSSLTDGWDSNQTTCLAQGPHGPDHFYVGAQATLYETDNLFATSRDISPPGVGYVYKIVVTNANPRRIVVACDGGVLWSTIPQPGGSYQWTQVIMQANGQNFPAGTYSGLALSRNVDLSDRIVAAAFGVNTVNGLYGIFYGDWSTGSLVLTAVPEANMPPVPPQSFIKFAEGMYRTSLASCSSQPEIMYAVAAYEGEYIYAVLKSVDRGLTWTLAPGTQSLSSRAGGQGKFHNCIAVAPTDPKRLLIGWVGTFQSTDSGTTFTALSDPGLHSDVHGFYFDAADSSNNTFYVCSDGGVAKTQDGGKTFDSSFNRYLANLECYCAWPRNFWGSLSVRGNLMATGTQDNSNVYCALRPGNTPTVSPWVQVDGGDGGWVALLATGQLISTILGPYAASSFRPRTDAPLEFGREGTVPVKDQNGYDTTGLVAFAVEPVTAPAYANMAGQKMYAVARGQRMTEVGAGAGQQNVYGLFANIDGSDLHWEKIGSVASDVAGDLINALATLDDGTSILIGTGNGRLFLLRPLPGGPVAGQKMVVSLPPQITQGAVYRIVFASATLAFATFNTNGGGHILRFDGTAWGVADSGLPGTNLFGLARDGYSRTWTCTDDKVWVSRDDGFSWKDASLGLPKRPHCAELRYNFVQQNPPLLYLSTYGHSVWVAGVLS